MGGSGGGSRDYTPGDLAKLSGIAKGALRNASKPDKHNVFISFAHEDLVTVNALRGQANNDKMALEFSDRSLHEPFDSEKTEYIKRGITERIRQASVTICLVSDHTAQSRWVDWEIRESIRLGKGVIAVHAGDNPPGHFPTAIREFGIKVIPWHVKEVMAAIDNASSNR